jgi:hypothetical protein
VIHDSVAGCVCFGYGDGFAALYAAVGVSHERCTSHDFDKEHVKCFVHHIPNRAEPVSPVGKQCGNVHRDGEDSCQGESTVPLSIGNAQGRKDWIDATIYELETLTSTQETIVLGRSL